ncbi:hypothetical protein D3C72_1895630 [compost metagenome]
MPVSTFIIVLLPEPLGPISPWIVPRLTVRSTWFSAFRPPNCISTLLAASRVSPLPATVSGTASCSFTRSFLTASAARRVEKNRLRTKPTMPSGR